MDKIKIKKILMYSQLKIIGNIKINDYATFNAIGVVPHIVGSPTE
jgi:hypothetical protein